MHHWRLQIRTTPGWRRHFYVCLKRTARKLIRKRRHLYAKCMSVLLASVVCGLVCYVLRDDRMMLVILYMLCNALFATVVATGSIDVLGNREERLLMEHEAASGVEQSAEALSRVIVDMLTLAPLAPIFAIPLQALSLMPIGSGPLVALYAQIAWTMAAAGYILSLLSPSNSTLLTAAITLILFAFFSGPLIGPSFLPSSMKGIFWLNPGYAAFLQIGLGNAVRMPFASTRWRLIQVFMNAEIMPADVPGSQLWEYDHSQWSVPSLISLLASGLVLRTVAIAIFAVRDLNFERFNELKRAAIARLLNCVSVRDDREQEMAVVHLDNLPAGQMTWKVDPTAPAPTGLTDSASTVSYLLQLPAAYKPTYSTTLAKYPSEIKTSLPSGARLAFTPHPRMKPGDVLQFTLPTPLEPSPLGSSDVASTPPQTFTFPVDCFTERSARRTTATDRERATVLVPSAKPESSVAATRNWVCPKCSFVNHRDLWVCEMCETERPAKMEHVRRNCHVIMTRALHERGAQSSGALASGACASTSAADASSSVCPGGRGAAWV